MQKKKNVIIAAVVIAVLAIAMAVVYFAARPKTTAGTKSFTVAVVHSDGSTQTFNFNAEAEYLGEALQVLGIIEGNTGEFGMYITTVDGEEAVYEKDSAYWALYVGEEYAQQGIDQTPVTDGGTYTLVYTVG